MDAVIIADRARPELSPLTDRTCAALLPVAGKTLVEHTLESLFDVGIRRAHVVTSEFADQVEATLSSGERWGMELRYVLTRGDEPEEGILNRIDRDGRDELLVIRADYLRSSSLDHFLTLAAAKQGAQIRAYYGGLEAGVALIRRAGPFGHHNIVDLPEARVSCLQSLSDYHQLQIEAPLGGFQGLNVWAREVAPGVTVGRQGRLPDEAISGKRIFVGARSVVHKEAAIGDDVALSDDVLVDQGAKLRNTAVLPGTYIGQDLEVRDAIVWGDTLVPVNGGEPQRPSDPSVLAEMDGSLLRKPLETAVHRFAGVVLLALSLPLWPIFFIANFLADSRSPFRERTFLGNRFEKAGTFRRRLFTTREGATRIAWLRHLPRLFAVARGDLRLIGVEPLTPTENLTVREEWENVREDGPVGLIGPWVLELDRSANWMERRMADTVYVVKRSVWGDFVWLLRGCGALVTSRAWSLAPVGNMRAEPVRGELREALVLVHGSRTTGATERV